jgi:hypothetical protein
MRLSFQTRLQEAAAYAGIEWSPTAIGESLGVTRQKAYLWMTAGEPRAAAVFNIADRWRVDARWLATGRGSMLPPPSGPDLSDDEVEMLKRYRKAEPRVRTSIIAMAKSLAKAASLGAVLWLSPQFNNNAIAAEKLDLSTGLIHIAALLRRWCKKLHILTPRLLACS